MSDRKYTILAFLGFILLCVIYVFNVNPDRYTNTFMVGDYYAPDSVSSAASANKIYEELAGGRQVACPQTEMVMSSENIAYITGIYLQSETNKYNNTCFFLTFDDIGMDNSVVSKQDYITKLNLKATNIENATALSLSSIVNNINDDYVEIVAPFKFIFNNVNTTDGNNKLEIINSAGNCMIVFEDVANWFCAGTPGTESNNNENSNTIPEDWPNHQHNTIIGNSANAVVAGGQAGQVIGYATSNTRVSIYYKNDSGEEWKPMTIKDWLLSGSTN